MRGKSSFRLGKGFPLLFVLALPWDVGDVERYIYSQGLCAVADLEQNRSWGGGARNCKITCKFYLEHQLT
jgi:hypothetical protein